jgi:hypothetical protein
MTVAQLMSFIRWKANVDSNSPYDNTTLLPIVNIAKNDVAQAIAQVNPNAFAETSTTATVSGEGYLQKPSDFLLYRRMAVSYSNTNPGSYNWARMVSLGELDMGEDYYASYGDTAFPLVRDEGTHFKISPTPTSTTAGAAFAQLWYTKLPPDFTDLTLTTDIFTLTGITKPFHQLIGEYVVNEIRGKQGVLTPLQVREENDKVRDALVPSAFSSISTFQSNVPSDVHLQH